MSHMCKISMTENQCQCHPSPWSPDSCSFKCRAAALYPSISSSSSSSSCSLHPPSQLLEKILVDCCGWWSWGKKEETQDAEGRWVGAAKWKRESSSKVVKWGKKGGWGCFSHCCCCYGPSCSRLRWSYCAVVEVVAIVDSSEEELGVISGVIFFFSLVFDCWKSYPCCFALLAGRFGHLYCLLLVGAAVVIVGFCYCCASTIFHPCWSSQLAAYSVALCQQIGLRWMPTGLLLEGKKERPPLMPPPLTIFWFSLFLMSPPVLSGFLWFVAAGSDRGGGNCRLVLMEEKRKNGWRGRRGGTQGTSLGK